MGVQRRIIVAVDLSGISQAAVATAERLAGILDAGVRVLYVAEPMTDFEDGVYVLPMLKRMAEETMHELEEDFKAFAASLPPPPEGVDRECVFATGKAHSEVIHHSRAVDAPLVVMGAPHPGALAATTFGRILRRAVTPVLVARGTLSGSYVNAIAGVDFSGASVQAMILAAKLSDPASALKIVNVVPNFSKAAFLEKAGELTERLTSELKSLAGDVLPGRAVLTEVRKGQAKSEIVEAGREAGADLLAVGITASPKLKGLFLGSVAEAVARNAACDVLVHSAERSG